MSQSRRKTSSKSSKPPQKQLAASKSAVKPPASSLLTTQLNPSPKTRQPPPAGRSTDPLPETPEPASLSSSTSSSTTSSLPLPPPFQPFFTLITDPSTASHHHPTVHYMFADDDADIITEAACRSLSQSSPENSLPHTQLPHHNSSDLDGSGPDPTLNSNKLPPPDPGVREHYIVVDIHPSSSLSPFPHATNLNLTAPKSPSPLVEPAYTISSAHSLSPSWALLSTTLSAAPTFDDEPPPQSHSQSHTQSQNLMLKIEALSATDYISEEKARAKGKGKAGNSEGAGSGTGTGGGRGRGRGTGREREKESVSEMVARFEEALKQIRRIAASGMTGKE